MRGNPKSPYNSTTRVPTAPETEHTNLSRLDINIPLLFTRLTLLHHTLVRGPRNRGSRIYVTRKNPCTRHVNTAQLLSYVYITTPPSKIQAYEYHPKASTYVTIPSSKIQACEYHPKVSTYVTALHQGLTHANSVPKLLHICYSPTYIQSTIPTCESYSKP